MCFLPFICAAVAGACAESGATGWAVFAGLCSVTFAIAHGAMQVADALTETDCETRPAGQRTA